MTNPFDLIIFDCDGVLVDSEALSARVLNHMLAELGVDIDFDYFCVKFLGRSFPTVAEDIRQTFDVALPDGFEAAYRAQLLMLFETDLRAMDGVIPVLEAMQAPFCLATSSSVERCTRSLAITGLNRFFADRVFTAAQVSRGKPAPDLFLLVASRLGVSPDRCLVIEDSLPGIEAATAAGMTVWRFTGGAHLRGRVLKHSADLLTFDSWAGFPVLLDTYSKSEC